MQNTLPIRLGIIGVGHMTVKRHLPALARLCAAGKCVMQGICDINLDAAQKAGKTYRIPFVTHDASALLERNDIDAVCVFGPADVHYSYGLAALKAGKHLFVEKPPAQNTSQLKEMCDAAQKRSLTAVAGFNRRFQRSIQEITKRIDRESLLTAEAVFNKPNATVPAPFGMRTWLGANSIHALDVLCFVMGERPTALYSVGNGGSAESRENFSALIEWGDRQATFSANNSAGSRLERYAFHGYGISFVCDGSSLHIYRSGEVKEEKIESTSGADGGIDDEFESFFDAIVSGTLPPHALRHALAALHLVELIENGHQGPINWSFLGETSAVPAAAQAVVSESNIRRVLPTKDAPSVLVLNPSVMKKELPGLASRFTIVYEGNLGTLSKEAREKVVAVITGGPHGKPLDTAHLAQLPAVSVLGVIGASVKKWGGALAIEHHIPIINTADVYADAVAEFIVMQALVGVRCASVSHDVMRRGGWNFSVSNRTVEFKKSVRDVVKRVLPARFTHALKFVRPAQSASGNPTGLSTHMLQGRTIGIIGYGEITKRTIPLFVAHGCRVLVDSEQADRDTLQSLGAEKASLAQALRADVVSLQRGLSPRTERSFGEREINTLRPGTVFINSARAGLVDTVALFTRLKKGDIFACLDVFDEEPLPRHDELRRLPNVFLTSHLAASISHVEGLIDASNRKLIEKISGFLEGKPVATIHTHEQFENMT